MEHFKEKVNRINSKTENVTLSLEMKDIYARIKIILENDDPVNKEIFNSIKNNEYATLIAEDASGRIPGLIMYELLRKVAERDQKTLPEIYFMAGSFSAKDMESKNKLTNNYLDSVVLKKHNPNKKVLVVTEYIMEGNSLKPITDGLKKQAINYDVLSIGLSVNAWSTIQAKREKLGNVANAKREIPGSIFRREDLSGVVKNPDEMLSKKSITADQLTINQIRKEVHIVADKLYSDI